MNASPSRSQTAQHRWHVRAIPMVVDVGGEGSTKECNPRRRRAERDDCEGRDDRATEATAEELKLGTCRARAGGGSQSASRRRVGLRTNGARGRRRRRRRSRGLAGRAHAQG
jgi:hypothetical protein